MTGFRSSWKGNGRTILLETLLAMGATVAFTSELKAQGRDDSRTARGTVERLNTAPKGEIDGAILDDGTFLHWPPHLEDRFSAVVRKGDRVEAAGRLETGKRGETRFEVRTLTNLDTRASAENNEPRGKRKKDRRGPPPGPRRSGPSETIRGTVERMNTAPKGEIDGAILEDGTFLHWPPHLEERFMAEVDEGDRVEALGFREIGKKGEERFEVEALTNLKTDKTVRRDDAPPHDRRRDDRREERRDERRDDRGAKSSRSERIRQLKQEVERLDREIERLERDL